VIGGRFCHPECNEGSCRQNDKILRFAQNDKKARYGTDNLWSAEICRVDPWQLCCQSRRRNPAYGYSADQARYDLWGTIMKRPTPLNSPSLEGVARAGDRW